VLPDNSSWGSFVQWGVWGIVMAVVMAWIARSRLRTRPESNARRLVHPRSTLVIGLVCFLFFGAIAVISNVLANNTTTWWTTTVFIGFALVSLLLVADYFVARHEVSEEGMSYGRLLGSRRFLKWSDLRFVRYAPVMKWFRLETRSGDVARISAMLIGLPEFARLILANAPAEAIEPGTLPILQATAHGNPPPVWG